MPLWISSDDPLVNDALTDARPASSDPPAIASVAVELLEVCASRHPTSAGEPVEPAMEPIREPAFEPPFEPMPLDPGIDAVMEPDLDPGMPVAPVAAPSEAEEEGPSLQTIALAVRDVRLVLLEQREQSQILTTKLNILFVTNGALLTSLNISRLMMIPSAFTVAEVIGFFISFILLVRAFLPRQVAVSPNLEDRKFLERYLALSPPQYQLQMLVNWAETYNANKQRLDDVSITLRFAAYATLAVATVMLVHILAVYVF